MEKWAYKSLEWIHHTREENYIKTKELSPAELLERTQASTEAVIKAMGLKVVRAREQAHTY